MNTINIDNLSEYSTPICIGKDVCYGMQSTTEIR